MPYKSKKQEAYLRKFKPKVAAQYDKEIKKGTSTKKKAKK